VTPTVEKRLECVRFIGAFPPAQDGQRFRLILVATVSATTPNSFAKDRENPATVP